MEKGLITVIQYSLGLGDDWEVDKILVDERKQRVGVYISHSGWGGRECEEISQRSPKGDVKNRTKIHLGTAESFSSFIFHCS